MRRSRRRTALLFVGFFCFLVGLNVAAFWATELHRIWWETGGDDGADEEVERNSSGAPSAADRRPDEPPAEEPGDAGPEPTYEEFVRGATDDGGELAPTYRGMPERGPSIRTTGGEEARTLPPSDTDYEVHIDGDLAAVTVEQIFYNPADSPVDAVYQFPLNRRAAVHGMKMDLGDRVVRAEIEKKERARELYERARRSGKQAALLSQQRPNWFTQRVANIGPEQAIEVELEYVQPLPKEDGTYQLVIPTNIGERFRDGSAPANDLDPTDGSSEAVPTASGAESDAKVSQPGRTDVSVEVHLDGAVPVRRIDSPSHRVRLRKYTPSEWWISTPDDRGLADDDFRLEYELGGSETRTGLNAFWDEEASRGYFSLLVEPPGDPDPSTISNREVVFVMDTSGSMEGARLETARTFVKRALRQLRRRRDSFRIVEFDNSASEFSEKPLRIDEQTLREASSYLDGLKAWGGTQYIPGLERAFDPEPPTGSVRLVVFLTDGYIGYEFEVLGKLRQLVGDARLFGIGIGESPNRYLLEEMARMGSGFAQFFHPDGPRQSPLTLDEKIDRTVERIESPVMTHIGIDWGDLNVQNVSPSPVPDLFAGGSVRIHGTYTNPGTHTVEVRGTVGPDRVSKPVTLDFPETEGSGRAVKLTWARQQIREQMRHLLGARARNDEEGAQGRGAVANQPTMRSPEAYRDRIVELGLEHSLTTQWTSFVAVSDSGPAGTISPGGASNRETAAGSGRLGASQSRGGAKGVGRGSSGAAGLGTTGSNGSGAAAAVTPDVQPSKPSVQGALDKEIIRNRIKAFRPKVKACYDRRLLVKPDLAGKVVIRFTIEPSGDIHTIEVDESNVDDEKLTSCMLRRLRRLTFPEVGGDDLVEVTYPYTFTSE